MRRAALFLAGFAAMGAVLTGQDKPWAAEPSGYRDIAFGTEFKQIVLQQGLIFTKTQFGPFGPKQEVIAAPDVETRTYADREESVWWCTNRPDGWGSRWNEDTYERLTVIPFRKCGPLKGGPFKGIDGAPSVWESFIFKDDKFVLAKWTFTSETQYGPVRKILVGKFGEPTTTKTGTVTNPLGEKLQSRTETWLGTSTIVQLVRFSAGLTDGSVVIATRSYFDEVEKSNEKMKQKAEEAF